MKNFLLRSMTIKIFEKKNIKISMLDKIEKDGMMYLNPYFGIYTSFL